MNTNNCLTTAIGSLPHKDVKKAAQVVLDNLPEVPIWPQLPQRSFKENMYIQYSENLPCVVCDERNNKIFFDTSNNLELQLEKFYQKYIDKDIDYFKISEDYALGFYTMLKYWAKIPPSKFIKGHITGPISFGLTITDENKKAIIYHEQLFDTVVKGLAMKGVWQISKFKEFNRPSIIFIDEPYLSGFGSAYVNLNKEEVIAPLDEIIDTIKKNNNVLVGIHCCGNTDWPLLMERNLDIISFDAYDFISNFALYPKELTTFLNRKGILAWGIVPSTEKVIKEDTKSLLERFKKGIELLSSKGIQKELLLKNLLITPSCGTGSLSEDISEKVFRLTLEIANQIKNFKW